MRFSIEASGARFSNGSKAERQQVLLCAFKRTVDAKAAKVKS
jgi:hypothetical protein